MQKLRPRGMTALAAVLGSAALAASVAGLAMLGTARPGTAPFEAAKWLLQLSVVFVGAGLITAVLRQAELTRADRAVWTGYLQEVIAGTETVREARLLLEAHATAATYAEQIKKLLVVRASLRKLDAGQDMHDFPELRDHLKAMQSYLETLISEYGEKYLPVSRQQRLDEAAISHHLKQIAAQSTADTPPHLPETLSGPLQAGRMLEDAARFPHLSSFRTGFESSPFLLAYRSAKPLLEHRAGIKRAAGPT